ncbi:hypothetical protein OGATHE_000547 [Ogataea polymorpha]|uniref:Uncharacterized protein n=1 Tax=Ogataea polymorpha TaxID=460523 RepID=A0A9P8PT19_9ASCO|nr:hypothetical protein OGATHE_000547 [Ogataea polymorpha]
MFPGTSVTPNASWTYRSTYDAPFLATSSKHKILSSARYMLDSSVPAGFSVLVFISSPWKYAFKGSPCNASYLYALNAPGRTVTNPNADSIGLSRMLDILYSKFCAAVSGFSTTHLRSEEIRKTQRPNFCISEPSSFGLIFFPSMALISPQAPPTCGSLKACQSL